VKMAFCNPEKTVTILYFRLTILRFHGKPVKVVLYGPGFPHPLEADLSGGGGFRRVLHHIPIIRHITKQSHERETVWNVWGKIHKKIFKNPENIFQN